MNYAEQLKKIRIQSGMTALEVAERMGNSFNEKAILAMESGERNLGISSIEKYAEACGFLIKIEFYRYTDVKE
ncbi:Helix-turn-helix domain-containing protein [Pseudarcicella hirudinis]|uniref:Helix-turn-helix domain-containing protein n=1 Tax=Pseudarcicella hirudinis TaxID=1079859 RepID=A0A1I5T250_9BACT|nr:helix-turn-helix transcriptional regulator [Pseudarcicella hirudinis]SFP77144.1 Helix-turn-helix domain-containing protein [Pseudarcicella hirudinis]